MYQVVQIQHQTGLHRVTVEGARDQKKWGKLRASELRRMERNAGIVGGAGRATEGKGWDEIRKVGVGLSLD